MALIFNTKYVWVHKVYRCFTIYSLTKFHTLPIVVNEFPLLMQGKVQVEFFCVVTQCNVVVGKQRFRGQCCLKVQDEV
jgi:hypothetical protein